MLYYGSTSIRNILLVQCGDLSVGPRAEMVNQRIHCERCSFCKSINISRPFMLEIGLEVSDLNE